MIPASLRTLGVLLVIAGFAAFAGTSADWLQRHAEHEAAAERFDAMAARLTEQVSSRMRTYEYGLRALRGVVVAAGGERMTRDQMRDYAATREIDREFRGARGFGVAFRVPPGDEARFVAAARREGTPDFAIHELGTHTGESDVIKFIEPAARNLAGIGLDIASEPKRHAAAVAAMRDGVATLTAPLELYQHGGPSFGGFLLLLPIYRTGAPIATPAQREAAALGWTYAPLASNGALEGLNLDDGELSVTLTDRDTQRNGPFFHGGTAAPGPSGFLRRATIAVYGRTWIVDVRSTTSFDHHGGVAVGARLGPLAAVFTALLAGTAALLLQSRRRQRRYRQEIARRAAIVEASEDAIVAETLGGIITDWNSGAERLFGFPASEVLGRVAAGLILPPERADEDARIRDVAARGERLPAFDTTRMHRDGRLIDVSVTAAPIRDGAGRCVGFAKTLRDIRETQAARRALSELNDSLERQVDERTDALAAAQRENAAILQTLHRHAIVSVADRTGRILDVNESFCRVSGYSAEELRGQNHRIVNSGQHDREFWRQMWRTIGSGEVWHGEVCNRAKDGSLYWVDSVIAPFLDADGRIEKYVSIRTDITPIKRLQQEAEDARQRATLASHAKSQFLANMSHEIRTPMNAVIGLTYLLRKTSLSQEQAGFVGKIGLAGRALLALINDILDLSKIEASEMRLEAVPFSLRDTVSEVSAIVGAQAETKGILFEVDLPREVPDGLVGDPTRVRQVLLNLLGNSVKFTERGRVRLAVERAPRAEAGEERAELVFRVDDTGIGIAPGQLQRLFQPFVQADTSTTRRFGGTGLGLSIVRQLVELMGGRIDVSSEPGLGSVFTARIGFPLAGADAILQARARPVMPAGGPALVGVSLLVVDDSEINLEVARRILEGEGARVTLAHDGREAVELLRAQPARADLVLMDVQMPVMDGHDATRHIRRELGLTALPIIALTAGMTTGERERAAAAGMNGVIGKPFDPDALVACILESTGSGERPHAGARAAAEPGAWPEIAGIDAADASRRMGGDAGLLNTLLSRFLKDTEALRALLEAPPADARGLARQLHGLKGSAATLGARELARLAGLAEESLLHEQAPRAGATAALASALDSLRAACAAHLARVEAADRHTARAAAELAPEALDGLARQLGQGDFAALDTVRSLSGGLRRRLGDEGFRALREACEELRFEEALEMLREGLPVSQIKGWPEAASRA